MWFSQLFLDFVRRLFNEYFFTFSNTSNRRDLANRCLNNQNKYMHLRSFPGYCCRFILVEATIVRVISTCFDWDHHTTNYCDKLVDHNTCVHCTKNVMFNIALLFDMNKLQLLMIYALQ